MIRIVNLILITGMIMFPKFLIGQSKKVYNTYYVKFTCKNPNGSYEYLRFEGENKIWYSNSYNKQEILLTLLNPNAECFKGFKVKFPNDNKIYILRCSASCENAYYCYNPDGTIQKFESDLVGSTYRCINPNKTIEYIYLYYTNSKNIKIKYSSSVNPNWVNLRVVNVKKNGAIIMEYEDIQYIDVKFPNDDKLVYRIIIPHDPNVRAELPYLIVKNPDGTKQKFQWINNED